MHSPCVESGARVKNPCDLPSLRRLLATSASNLKKLSASQREQSAHKKTRPFPPKGAGNVKASTRGRRNQLTMVSVLLTTCVIFWGLSCPFWKVSLTLSWPSTHIMTVKSAVLEIL